MFPDPIFIPWFLIILEENPGARYIKKCWAPRPAPPRQARGPAGAAVLLHGSDLTPIHYPLSMLARGRHSQNRRRYNFTGLSLRSATDCLHFASLIWQSVSSASLKVSPIHSVPPGAKSWKTQHSVVLLILDFRFSFLVRCLFAERCPIHATLLIANFRLMIADCKTVSSPVLFEEEIWLMFPDP